MVKYKYLLFGRRGIRRNIGGIRRIGIDRRTIIIRGRNGVRTRIIR